MFDFFSSFLRKKPLPPVHPTAKPGHSLPLSVKNLKFIFADCADLESRSVIAGGRGSLVVTVLWLDGLVSGTDVSEDILRPLSENASLSHARSDAELLRLLENGGIYSCSLKRCDSLPSLCDDLLRGRTAVICGSSALSFDTKSRDTRSISEPRVEKSILGAKDAFTESLRVNTALLRRHLRTSELKLVELTVGRRSGTRLSVSYIRDVARPERVEALLSALREIDIDGVTSPGDLAAYLSQPPRGSFPQLEFTERPDRLSRSLRDGRIALFVDGLPQALMLPCTLPLMLRVEEDRSLHAAAASLLTLLRWAALLISLLLPAFYTAVAMYHQEMIPHALLLSVIEAKQSVPFTTAAEILGTLAAFALLQEAGLRLPDPAGTTVSIIGALIVGQSAVEARVVSPIAVIVVALAAIAGYTQPDQQLGTAIRLWRFTLVLCAVALGLVGVMAGLVLLLWRLCESESLGVSYLYPLCDSRPGDALRSVLRPPLRLEKLRAPALSGKNRRKQK